MRGISTRKTNLGWNVIRVHYEADPAKDPLTPEGKRWQEQAKVGMSEARWKKEMEIDYGAMGGRLCFPGFDPSLHVCEPFELRSGEWKWSMACDPHPARAHAFVWLAVNSESEMVIPFSWSSTTWTGKETIADYYVPGIKLIEEERLQLKPPIRRVMDSAGKGMKASEEQTFFDRYRQAGITFQPAKKNRDYAGFDLINEALKPYRIVIGNERLTRARLRIFGLGNEELIWQFQHTRYQEWRGNVDKDAPEKPQEKRKDLIDCVSYILLERPRLVLHRPEQRTLQEIYDAMPIR